MRFAITALITLALLTSAFATSAEEPVKQDVIAQSEGVSPQTTTPTPPGPTTPSAADFIGKWKGTCHVPETPNNTSMFTLLVEPSLEAMADVQATYASGKFKFKKGRIQGGGLHVEYVRRGTLRETDLVLVEGKLNLNYYSPTGLYWICSLGRSGSSQPPASPPATDQK